MSSYLNLYLKPKESERKLLFSSINRSSDIYTRFYENGVKFIEDSNGEEQYTNVTVESINSILDEIDEEINRLAKRTEEYRKHANGNIELINEILANEELLAETRYTKSYFNFLKDIVYDIQNGYTSFEGMYANYD